MNNVNETTGENNELRQDNDISLDEVIDEPITSGQVNESEQIIKNGAKSLDILPETNAAELLDTIPKLKVEYGVSEPRVDVPLQLASETLVEPDGLILITNSAEPINSISDTNALDTISEINVERPLDTVTEPSVVKSEPRADEPLHLIAETLVQPVDPILKTKVAESIGALSDTNALVTVSEITVERSLDTVTEASVTKSSENKADESLDSLLKPTVVSSISENVVFQPSQRSPETGVIEVEVDALPEYNNMDMTLDVTENLSVMDPDNPLMKRVQDALYKQLTSVDEKLNMEIREKEEELKKTKNDREKVGVELYGLQQQLAKVQQSLEDSQVTFTQKQTDRQQAESAASETRTLYLKQKQDLQDLHKAYESRQRELDDLMRTLSQVEFFYEEMKGKLSITRRMTKMSEQDLYKQEKEKRKQDFAIFSLTQRLDRLNAEKATIQKQIDSQQVDIRALHMAVQEANTEMEAIVFEKRQLLHQWKSGLIGLQRRHDVLITMYDAIKNETENLMSLELELKGFKNTLKSLGIENENLMLFHNKIATESEYLSEQLKQLNEKHDTLRHEYSIVQRALESEEEQAKQIKHQRQTLVNQLNKIQKQIHMMEQKSTKLENEIAEQIQNQISIDQGMSFTMKDAKKLTSSIHEKEEQVAQNENALFQLKLENLRMSEKIQAHKSDLGLLDKTISAKNNIIENYELEIRRSNSAMMKKQTEIDLNNKKLSQTLASLNGGESAGPLEATIYNLTKLIQVKEKESWELQHYWLRAQNDLVVTSKTASDVAELISNLKMKQTVLSRKRIVINQAFDAEEMDIKLYQRNIKCLQTQMVKANTFIANQGSKHSALGESTFGLEQEFRCRLKEAEVEAIHLEDKVKRLKTEKDRSVDQILEMEQKIMQWERKLQIAKETKEALDPNIGNQEIQEMNMEIHRMELRLASLLKVQERLITEMEKAVYRRETIAVRAKLRAGGKGHTQSTLNKQISDTHKHLKSALQDLRLLDKDLDTLEEALSRVRAQVENAQLLMQATYKTQASLVTEIQIQLDTKLALLSVSTMLQKRVKKWQAVKESKYVFTKNSVSEREADASKAWNQLERIEKAVNLLMINCANELGPTTRSLDVYLKTAIAFANKPIGIDISHPST